MRVRTLALVAAALLFAQQASANSVVFSQAPASPVTGRTSQYIGFGTTGFGFNAFDDFTLTQTTAISTVTWEGFYFNAVDSTANPAPANATFFGLQFFANDPTATAFPTLLASNFFTPGGANETFVGNVAGPLGFPVSLYDYRATVATPFVALANTTYWLRVFAYEPAPSAVDPQWSWSGSSGGTGLQYLDNNLFGGMTNRAFELVTPEPATLVLTMTGLLGAMVRRRRQRR